MSAGREPSSDDVVAEPTGPVRRFTALSAFRERFRRLPGGRLVWRIGVAVLGLAVIITGIVLLPLPGPGWLIIFLGLGVWATEFEWARRLLRFAQRTVGAWTAWLSRQPRWLQLVIGGALLIVVGAFIVGGWWVYRSI
jgi:uncharacterized protein (TIGR02611 family)